MYFDRSVMKMEDYFFREEAVSINDISSNNRKLSSNFESSRELKSGEFGKPDTERPKDDIMKLDENKIVNEGNVSLNIGAPEATQKSRHNEANSIVNNNYLNDTIDKGSKRNSGLVQPMVKMVPITLPDYYSLRTDEIIIFDKRGFSEYIKNILCDRHILINLFTKKSLMVPLYLRTIKLLFELTLIFTINALLYSEGYISTRANSPNKVIKHFNTFSISSSTPCRMNMRSYLDRLSLAPLYHTYVELSLIYQGQLLCF
jgi:hypothetical protein